MRLQEHADTGTSIWDGAIALGKVAAFGLGSAVHHFVLTLRLHLGTIYSLGGPTQVQFIEVEPQISGFLKLVGIMKTYEDIAKDL